MQPVHPATDRRPDGDTEGDLDRDPDRGFRRRLGVVVALGALWRLGVLVVDKWHQPLLLNDSLYYSAQAQQLADGIWFREIFVDRPGAEHGPLTSTILAVVSWVDDPVPWQRLVTVLFGVLTIAMVGVLARRIAGPRVGLVAAAIAAVYPNLWMNDGLVMSESISIAMVCLTLWTAHRCLSSPSLGRAAVVGLVAGLAALARSELALLSPLVGVLLAVTVWRAAEGDRRARAREALTPMVLLGAVAAATVAPWVAFNMARFEEPVTLTTNDGTTLLGSYCDTTFSGPELGGWSIFCVTSDPAYSMDEEPSVRSARQREMALEYARDHLDELPKVVAARIARTLDLYGLDSLVAQDVGEERYRWASWAGIAMWWVVAPAAIAGAVVLARASRARTRRSPRWVPAWAPTVRWSLLLLACPVLSVTVTTVLFYGAHRIRSSMEPTVVVLAAVAAVAWWDHRAARSARAGERDVIAVDADAVDRTVGGT